jgi:hypothetical protein
MKIPVPRIISTVDIANGDDSEIQDAKEKEKKEHEKETDRQTNFQELYINRPLFSHEELGT